MIESYDKMPAEYQEFTELLRDAVAQCRFGPARLGGYNSSKFRNIYYSPSKDYMRVFAILDRPRLPKKLLSALVDRLQSMLVPFVADDRVGEGLALFVGGIPDPPLTQFAVDLVRAAVLNGPEQTTLMLHRWANGEDVSYRICAILTSISVDQTLEMDSEIRFESLPEFVEMFSDQLPFSGTTQLSPTELSRAVKVTIDCKARPAFYTPGEYETKFEQTWTYGPLPNRPLTILCQALSLVLNHCVMLIVAWKDSDEARALGRDLDLECNYPDSAGNTPDKKALSQKHLSDFQGRLEKLLIKSHEKNRLGLAIRRWMLSKRRTSLSDQFIELRIALEALYLKGYNDELGFRLASYGAWHLGTNFEERRRYQQILRQAYREASKAVHSGEVKDKPKLRKLLTEAQDLCRAGILKRLDENETPNWDEMMLGKELGTSP